MPTLPLEIIKVTEEYGILFNNNEAFQNMLSASVLTTRSGVIPVFLSVMKLWKEFTFGNFPKDMLGILAHKVALATVAVMQLFWQYSRKKDGPEWMMLMAVIKTLRGTREVLELLPEASAKELDSMDESVLYQMPKPRDYNSIDLVNEQHRAFRNDGNNSCFCDTLFFMMFMVEPHFDKMLMRNNNGAFMAHRQDYDILFSNNPSADYKEFINLSQKLRIRLTQMVTEGRTYMSVPTERIEAVMSVAYLLDFDYNTNTEQRGQHGPQQDIVELYQFICRFLDGYDIGSTYRSDSYKHTVYITDRSTAEKVIGSGQSMTEVLKRDKVFGLELGEFMGQSRELSEMIVLVLPKTEVPSVQYLFNETMYSSRHLESVLLFDASKDLFLIEGETDLQRTLESLRLWGKELKDFIRNDSVLLRQTVGATRIVHKPKVLSFYVERYFRDPDGTERMLNNRVPMFDNGARNQPSDIPLLIKRTQDTTVEKAETCNYRIFAVACKSGVLKQGHYYCYFRKGNSWFKYDDTTAITEIFLPSERDDMAKDIETRGYLFFAHCIDKSTRT